MFDHNITFLIVGLGLMGGSYARGLSSKGYHVTAIDIDASSIAYALEHQFIKAGASTPMKELIETADVIVLALYPTDCIDWLRLHQDNIKPHAVISDVSGVKGILIKEIQSFLRDDLEFIAAHPMAGKEVSGVIHSDASLFQNANLIITPTTHNTAQATQLIQQLGDVLGFRRISILTPQVHDEMIGFLSQLTHVIAVCLMNTHESENLIAYSGDSFRDLTRIAKINEQLWSELFLLNKDILLQEITKFIAELQQFSSVLQQENREELIQLLQSSTKRRKAFDQ